MNSKIEEIRIQSGKNKLYVKLWFVGDEKPVVIFLSGVGFHTFEYEPLATIMSQKGYNCLAFDFRGHGHSEGRRGFWTLQDLVNDTRCVLDYVSARFSGKIYLFGNSLGAMIGVYAAQDARISRIVASNCPARLSSFMLNPSRRLLFALAKLVSLVLPLRISLNHFYSYNQLIDDPKWVATFTNDHLITDARRLSVTAYNGLLEEWDGVEAIRKVHIPLLIMQGKKDHMQPSTEADKLYTVANKPKLLELINTGHLPHLENPNLVADILIRWFTHEYTNDIYIVNSL